jgi:hypothetical protein
LAKLIKTIIDYSNNFGSEGVDMAGRLMLYPTVDMFIAVLRPYHCTMETPKVKH